MLSWDGSVRHAELGWVAAQKKIGPACREKNRHKKSARYKESHLQNDAGKNRSDAPHSPVDHTGSCPRVHAQVESELLVEQHTQGTSPDPSNSGLRRGVEAQIQHSLKALSRDLDHAVRNNQPHDPRGKRRTSRRVYAKLLQEDV